MESLHHPSLPTIRIQNPTFEAEILLQGAQLMHFAPRGQLPWIFRSPNTPYTPRREIYSGVPVIFPWFGRLPEQPEAPNHGFARQANWKFEPREDDTRIIFALSADEVREQGIDTTLWPYDFTARMIYEFGDSLGMRLEILNESGETCRFECSLHTYFAVENLDEVRVEGLNGKQFREGGKGEPQTQTGPIRFDKLLTQVYETGGGAAQIHDQNRTYTLTPRAGWNSTIVWNPGAAMADLSAEDARGFVCVEAGAIREGAVTLEPGQTYALDFSIQATENTQSGTENN
jgi:glucose-6-phosphate 1-epimerase